MNTPALHIDWDTYFEAVNTHPGPNLQGKIVKVVGLIAEGHGVGMSIGSRCLIENDLGETLTAEVVGFKEDRVLLMPYGDTRGIRPGVVSPFWTDTRMRMPETNSSDGSWMAWAGPLMEKALFRQPASTPCTERPSTPLNGEPSVN